MEQPEVKEILLVEDGSTDESLAVCKELEAKHEEVRVLVHPGGANRGAAASRNLAMRAASREFIAFLDADDVFLAGRFDAERAIFKEKPDADGVYGGIDAYFHSSDLEKRFATTYAVQLTTVRHMVAPEHLFDAHIGLYAPVKNLGHFSLDGLTLRATSLARMPMLMREDLHLREDTEFIMRTAYYLRLHPGHIDRAVASRGLHPGNRITNVQDRPLGKQRFYMALHEWAQREGIGSARCKALLHFARGYELEWACARRDLRTATMVMLRTPALWRRLDKVYDYIDVLAGKGSWLGDRMKECALLGHRLLWWFRGGAPPEVVATWSHGRAAGKSDPSPA
ncbi:MAG: glycosyltransferase [Flavobacteriales bacterium]|nr:glycosyltransferase [Flavobacteriales bacterium]